MVLFVSGKIGVSNAYHGTKLFINSDMTEDQNTKSGMQHMIYN